MMKNKIIIILLTVFALNPVVFAQEVYRVIPSKSTIRVEGTSSLHDWEMIAEKMNASLEVIGEKNSIKDIKDVSFSLDAKNLLSDNSIMNNKAQDALKSKKYKEIRFELESITGLKNTSTGFSGYASGNLFIAGKTKKVEFPFSAKINGNSSLVVSGNEKINMSDFDIDAPTAMLGTLKTGDEINIKFELEFDKL